MLATLGILGVTGGAASYLAYRWHWGVPSEFSSQAPVIHDLKDPMAHIQFPSRYGCVALSPALFDPSVIEQRARRTSQSLLYLMGYEIHPTTRIQVNHDPHLRAESFKLANRALGISLGVTGRESQSRRKTNQRKEWRAGLPPALLRRCRRCRPLCPSDAGARGEAAEGRPGADEGGAGSGGPGPRADHGGTAAEFRGSGAVVDLAGG